MKPVASVPHGRPHLLKHRLATTRGKLNRRVDARVFGALTGAAVALIDRGWMHAHRQGLPAWRKQRRNTQADGVDDRDRAAVKRGASSTPAHSRAISRLARASSIMSRPRRSSTTPPVVNAVGCQSTSVAIGQDERGVSGFGCR